MRRLLLETSVPKIYMLVMISISVLMLGGYFSYAMFTVQKEKKSAISIVTGNLTGTLTVDGVSSNKLIVPASTTKTFIVVLSNNNARKARYNFYYTGSLASNISAGYIVEEGSNTPPKETGVILEATGTAGSSASYKIKIKNNSSNSITITLGYQVGLENINLALPSNSNLFTEMPEDPTLVDALIAEANSIDITTYENGDKSKMYTFDHEATEQTEALRDYRYIGDIPNNYITFNDELWRIIGVFTVEDKDGMKEQRVKIMREESIGNYSWDNTTVESNYGKNDWTTARLMKLLNPGYENESMGGSLYWNRKKGTCYAGFQNVTTDCDFTTFGLSEEAKALLSEVKWYLGAYDAGQISAINLYQKERGTMVYSSDRYPRKANWIGTVGLMYPSDDGYTYGLGVENRCFSDLGLCYSSVGNTPKKGWLYNAGNQWTLFSNLNQRDKGYIIDKVGRFVTEFVHSNIEIRPAVYLQATVKLSAGIGTISNPFQIS